jgi:hypothetical protein
MQQEVEDRRARGRQHDEPGYGANIGQANGDRHPPPGVKNTHSAAWPAALSANPPATTLTGGKRSRTREKVGTSATVASGVASRVSPGGVWLRARMHVSSSRRIHQATAIAAAGVGGSSPYLLIRT